LHQVYGEGKLGNWFDNSVSWLVGNESQVKFWKDKWIDKEHLCSRYPRMYFISSCKDKNIGELRDWNNNSWK